jgi:hypothetical protein
MNISSGPEAVFKFVQTNLLIYTFTQLLYQLVCVPLGYRGLLWLVLDELDLYILPWVSVKLFILLNLDDHLLDRGMKEQDFDLRQNAYHNSWQPYLAYWGCAWSAIFVLINGLTVFFGKFNVSGFFAACELLKFPL